MPRYRQHRNIFAWHSFSVVSVLQSVCMPTFNMRYQNWDVLLFPGPSRVPIQEFDTKFHVLTSTNRPSAASIEDPFTDNQYESMNKLALLTCFIASQAQDSPFRVSIHSWARPTPSSILSGYKTQEEAVAFQARVYIDGIHHWSVLSARSQSSLAYL